MNNGGIDLYNEMVAFGSLPPFRNILVLPREQAQRYKHDTDWVCISINDPDYDFAKISGSTLKDLLQLKFWDIDKPIGRHIEIFKPEMADLIWNFVDLYWNPDTMFVIHCLAGISRSSAVAAAIAKDKYGDDTYFFNRYLPNSLVYRTLMENRT